VHRSLLLLLLLYSSQNMYANNAQDALLRFRL